ncbi:hypothetical protein RK21_04360 [Pseudomonas plecoglossicida]|nr:hypothetical protein RK21_04360 [Pseudomonas plecoglossicida]
MQAGLELEGTGQAHLPRIANGHKVLVHRQAPTESLPIQPTLSLHGDFPSGKVASRTPTD